MKKLLLIVAVLFVFCSCRSTRGYEYVTKNYIGYGTYKAPNKKGLDK
jgi:hypothetical protein